MNLFLAYKILWLNFIFFHYFESISPQVIPLFAKVIVIASALTAVAVHSFDKKNYGLLIHKVLFISLSFFPFAIDNRTTVALFESVAVIYLLLKSPDGFPVKRVYFWLLGLTFFFAGFHKMNSTHLFEAGSCSREFIEKGLAYFQLSGPYAQFAVEPWLVVGCELLLPFLLLLRWYRLSLLISSMLLLSFAVLGFANFTALLLILSAPLFFVIQDRQFKNAVLLPWALSFLTITVLHEWSEIHWKLLTCMLAAFFLANLKPKTFHSDSSKSEGLFNAMFATAFILNSMSVYTGYKNQGVLSMYSNLQIHDGKTNHLIITKPFLLSANATEVATIISSDLPIHQQITGENGQVPVKLLKLQARYYYDTGASPKITFRIQDHVHIINTREQLLDFSKGVSFFDRYFLNLGYVDSVGTKCHW